MKAIWLKWAICMVSLSFSVSVFSSPWEGYSQSSNAPSESVGSYANGCLIGAKALPLEGQGYQVLRSQNKRYYGHPEAIQFIIRLAQKAGQDLHTHLLIGDMSLPQGGRFSSGHSSHQTGLDIDIWFRLADKKLSENTLKVPKPQSLVDMKSYRLIDKNWDDRHFQMVKMAAQDKQVTRIFVHPLIKEKLCRDADENRDWLRKVRPWWGHNYHMHVRLACPSGEATCVNQAPPPAGDGCGKEVASWHPKYPVKTVQSKKKEPSQDTSKVAKPKPKKIMPQQCLQIVQQNQ
ncbi:penicillin-insensitive murein endopeptidase [Vibrio renipiscarius]|uniref:penicillin-insensitive murein endopeptidase n=1 Tax=Vibrio renipiscarius TaxID=1461322 RepID=UPI00354DE92D